MRLCGPPHVAAAAGAASCCCCRRRSCCSRCWPRRCSRSRWHFAAGFWPLEAAACCSPLAVVRAAGRVAAAIRACPVTTAFLGAPPHAPSPAEASRGQAQNFVDSPQEIFYKVVSFRQELLNATGTFKLRTGLVSFATKFKYHHELSSFARACLESQQSLTARHEHWAPPPSFEFRNASCGSQLPNAM